MLFRSPSLGSYVLDSLPLGEHVAGSFHPKMLFLYFPLFLLPKSIYCDFTKEVPDIPFQKILQKLGDDPWAIYSPNIQKHLIPCLQN